MFRIAIVSAAIALAWSGTAVADEFSTVLQDGNMGYTGCTDARVLVNIAIRDGNVLDTSMLPFPDGSGSEIDLYHSKAKRCESTFDPLMIIGGMLVRFDLAAIPADARITDARLELYAIRPDSLYVNAPKTLFPILSSWSEADATWETLFLQSYGIDDASPVRCADTGSAAWEGFAVGPIIQDMVNGSRSNEGFMIVFESASALDVSNEEVKNSCRYAAHEHADSNLRPKLSVNYTVGEAVVNTRSNYRPDQNSRPSAGISQGQIHISSGKAAIVDIDLCSVNGRVVQQFRQQSLSAGNTDIPLGAIPAGAYVLTIRGHNTIESMKTFIQ